MFFGIGMAFIFWNPCISTYFSLRYPSRLCFHIYIKQVFSWWTFLQITEDIKGYLNSKNSIWIGQLSVKSCIWIGLFFFKGRKCDWGWFQNTDLHTNAKITMSLSPLTVGLKLFTFSLRKLCAIIFFATSCPNYALWMTRYHLELLYSNEAHPTACAMLETGAMSIRRKNEAFFRTPVDLNLEQMSMLMFHPD